jgi:hypothetical protein
MQITKFLKAVLTMDGLSCLAIGAGLTIGSSSLAPLFGLADGLVFWAGAALLPVGAFILAVASRRDVMPLFVWAIILGNVLWVVESLIVAADTAGITALGTAFVVAQAAAVAVLTALETAGVLRGQTASRSRTQAA